MTGQKLLPLYLYVVCSTHPPYRQFVPNKSYSIHWFYVIAGKVVHRSRSELVGCNHGPQRICLKDAPRIASNRSRWDEESE